MTKDMTTGNPVKLILYFSIPLLIGNIFQQFYSMVDTIIVGRFLGVKALAAVGSTSSMIFLIIGFILGLASGFSVLVSQRFGANDEEGVKKAVGSAIVLSVIMTIIITILSIFFTKPLLNLMKTPHDIIDEAYSYIIIIYGGIFVTFFYNIIASILRALGDSKTPLYFLIVASILNIILDLMFIVKFSMGVKGAAYATVISQGVSGILCLIYTAKKFPILRLEKRHFSFNLDFYKKHLNIGIPMALQFSITAVGAVILQGAVNSFGSTIVAAYTAASRVEQLVMQPSVTFGVTMATYCAQNLGANNIERIKEGVKKCTLINIAIGVIGGIILMTLGEYFVKLFVSNSDPNVISYATKYLTTVSFFFIPLSLIFIYRNALQGMGYTFVPMMAGVYELLARTIVAFTLPLAIGYTGICLAGPMAWLAASIPLFIDYHKKVNSINSSECYSS
ncbi:MULTISPECIES: MATE family efflux transporter [Romboutsia]|uniref:MATE efflux protein n=1 Tax=Romboutsia hominis TaxID=1507512 RepID=A0A2P2BRC5_9FIRM|nr:MULTISPECIES: MATE family efflux transporter [Romboutsia]MCH1960248.1 MATE family efflux transporter [Romboutsia hominis]MCH1969317.1 MATE family efflux transporter [Romboutsia hominis]MDB8791607.1 MATE family efflux transporter [Romboutsia sp. 1001216sp1]MDB8794059.1 MATE family efflux transporter [Romboutsia sp. 1001216sp1]MDB8796395.1 MATE family efflux transporter [Romboutsia sp. 1001216sp1]